eukprot:TRINITY_DN1573_c0_g2_i2.p1 TRINITY_DN1573_c0_g2~~TRINITY_DN1573_c0_g2_i2.p1  ORF type:complete len:247 (-),score=33.56 TRINITY_DN1573_c0_g2_i2:284-1024(-)
MDAKVARQDDAPVLSKDLAAYVLAFLNGWYDVQCFGHYKAFTLRQTGSTMNLGINVVTRDATNVKFFGGVLLYYSGGCALFKFLDLMHKDRSLSAAAPVLLTIQALNDQLRNAFPDSRLHMWLLALTNGLFNTACAEKFGCLTHVVTGHYQRVSTDLVTLLIKGLSKDQLRATRKAALVLVAFFCGAASAQVTKNMKQSFVAAFSRHKFGLLGLFYAITLVLGELPASRLFGCASKRVAVASDNKA